jgi:two-component system nitrate/nitrite response regulator NarL
MTEAIRIVLVDDHPLFRDGVASTLQADPDFEVVGQGASAAEAVRLAQDLLPDMIVLDIDMPGSGLNAVPLIAAACPAIKIVMLTVSEQEDDVLHALKLGAHGYVLKGITARELRTILRAVCAGEVWVSPTLAAGLLREMTGKPAGARGPADPLGELTERERQILQLVAAGRSNKEIGGELYLTEKTVKHYMTNILQKLQVRNRVEAALVAQKATGLGRRE